MVGRPRTSTVAFGSFESLFERRESRPEFGEFGLLLFQTGVELRFLCALTLQPLPGLFAVQLQRPQLVL